MSTRILAIDDDTDFLTFLTVSLKPAHDIITATSWTAAQPILASQPVDLVLLDIGLGADSGMELLDAIKRDYPATDVVMVSGNKDPQFVVDAVRRGASDYLVKPFAIEELIAQIEKLTPYRVMREKHAALLADMNVSSAKHPMLGDAPAFRAVLDKARCVRGYQANVLIEGESGTGKELLARYLHQLEERTDRPFVTVNCAAIPENLLESELFGHERGAFTGAHQRKIGKFELANGGDIFLDEMSTLKWDLQAKILRALQEKEICRVGGNDTIRVDFRLIAATNDNLEGMVDQGKFRRDLFHRVRVIHLHMPPLRQRADDIPLLVQTFLQKHANGTPRSMNAGALRVLQSYYWPGNIRELENLIQSLVILAAGPVIRADDLPEWVYRKAQREAAQANLPTHAGLPDAPGNVAALKQYIDQAERAYVSRTLELTKGDKSKAAALLEISRTRLYERLKIWGMMNGGHA